MEKEENLNNEIIPMRPLDENGNPKSTFEVKIITVNGGIVKKIFVDGLLLDWEVDISSLMEAQRMGAKYFKAAQKDIEKHFAESVSEVIGRKVNVDDIKKAIETGWI